MKHFFCIVFFFCMSGFALAAAPNVLVLHSYHPGLSWTDTLNRGIRERFQEQAPGTLLWVEYLDAKRNTDPTYLALQASLLRYKLAGSCFQLIVTTDHHALSFVLNHRQDIFRSAPVVFCGINGFQPDILQGQKFITGLAENPAFKETMQTVLRLHPGTQEFIIIGGNENITDRITNMTLQTLEPSFPAIRFTYWNNISATALRTRLAKLKPGSVIFVHGVLRNEEGVLVDYREKNAFLARYSPVPLYGFWDFEMGTGCVGGKLVEGYEEGRRAADLGIQVLQGVDPQTLPVNEHTPSRYIFDYRQLQKFSIDTKLLPENSLVLFEPTHVYHIDKRFIWVAILALAALLGTLTMLLAAIRRRKEAQNVLSRHKKHLEAAVQARTEHLRVANDELEHEVHERIRAEGNLRKAQASLKIEVERRTRDLRFEIEQRRQAEDHIRDREAKARALLNAPSETMLLVDQKGIILDINETGASRLGTNRESLFGVNLYAIMDQGRSMICRRAVRQVCAKGEARSVSDYGQGQDVDIRLYPVFSADGEVTRVAMFMADVTQARRMASQIMLLDKINSLGRMAAGIAHEIRNPLTGVHGYLYAMDDVCSELPESSPRETLQDIIAKIRSAAGKMESVIRRVLDFSRPGTPALGPLDLHRPIRDALSLMSASLRKAHIEIETELLPVPPIMADPMQIEQAVINILDNAARAVVSTPDRHRIIINLRPVNDMVCLCIGDSGPGIPREKREQIFDPFFTTAPDGTGIGLSIVQRIVADHGGRIRIDRSMLGGAEFCLEFPLSQPGESHAVFSADS